VRLRVLTFQGSEYYCKNTRTFRDDSTTNAIEIIECSLVDWSKKDRIRPNEGTGYNGDWREDIFCDTGTYMYSAEVQNDLYLKYLTNL
jgi:hypothetical protein